MQGWVLREKVLRCDGRWLTRPVIDHVVLLRNYFSNTKVSVFGTIFCCDLRIKLLFCHYDCLRLRVRLIGRFDREAFQQRLILHPHCLKWRKQRATCHLEGLQ